ncbi:unnamed protein product [Closterium sp. NIES-53]
MSRTPGGPEGDPDALDIPTPRSYAEAIEGPYSSQWQAVMDAEMASWSFALLDWSCDPLFSPTLPMGPSPQFASPRYLFPPIPSPRYLSPPIPHAFLSHHPSSLPSPSPPVAFPSRRLSAPGGGGGVV